MTWKYLPGGPLSPFMPEVPACPWGPAGSWGPAGPCGPSRPSLPCCCSSNLTSPQRVELMVVCTVDVGADSALLSDLGMAETVRGKVLLDLCKSANVTSSLQNMSLAKISMYHLHDLHLDACMQKLISSPVNCPATSSRESVAYNLASII